MASALRLAIGRRLAMLRLAAQDRLARRVLVRKMMGLIDTDQQLRFVEYAGRLAASSRRHEYVDIYWLALANSAAVESTWEHFCNPDSAPHAKRIRQATNRPYAQALAAYELGRYKDAVAGFLTLQEREPDELKVNYDYLKAAYAAGKVLDKDLALEFFARQFANFVLLATSTNEGLKPEIIRRVTHDTIATLSPQLAASVRAVDTLRVGVFYLSSTEALGHAILDAYHFLALHRNDYDRIFFVGPSRESYRAGSRACLAIVEQYGTYVETASDALLNLSWMNLGSFDIGPLDVVIQDHRGYDPDTSLAWYGPRRRCSVSIELVVEHYWSLLREVVQRSASPEDGFRHNGWHLSLPGAIESLGEEFCEDEGIDLEKPLVVLHARDERYHNIGKQSHRDARIDNYIPAIEHLLDAGYQVVRLGDDQMSKLRIGRGQYWELPFLKGYEHHLDPFLVSRARFMIGCQSGPCSYARAFGVPLLSVNAVLHYTLLPAIMEMACFKRYFRLGEAGDFAEELDIEDALEAGTTHFDNSYQYRANRIGVRDASSDEILAAVKDMIAWLAAPELPETEHQRDFREAVARRSAWLREQGPDLDLPIGDYLGISLPGYRISPTVADMRAGVASHESVSVPLPVRATA